MTTATRALSATTATTAATATTATAAALAAPDPGTTMGGDGAVKVPVPVAVEWHFGSLMIWHLTGAETGGDLSLGEVVVRQGAEPPMHIHAREDETWYVIEGTVLFQRGHERLLAGPGSAVLLPRGIPHGFAVQSPQARILHAYAPAGLEAAFRAVSTPVPVRELPPPAAAPDDAQLARVSEVYGALGVTFIGPPLAALLAQENR